MLGKLFKHEWKSTYKVGLLMLGALAIVTLIGVLGCWVPNLFLGDNMQSGEPDVLGATLSMIISMASFWIYTMALMGVVYGMLIYMGIRFYKTMYSDEGYLTHTLPVTPHQLIVSKVVNAGIWTGLVSLGMSLSIIVFMIAMFASMEVAIPSDESFQIIWKEMFREFGIVGPEVIHMIIAMILAAIIGPFSSMMTLLGSLTIGQLAPKFKAVLGVVVYFGVASVQGMIAFVISMAFSVGNLVMAEVTNTMPSMACTYDASVVVLLIMLVGFYFISRAIITKKLNLS